MFDWIKRREARKAIAPIIGGLLRTVLAMVGGAGVLSDSEIEQAAGVVAGLAIGAWSVWQKIQAKREQDRRVAEATRKNGSGSGSGTAGAGGG